MITCDKCGTKLPENAEFCAYCGSEIKKTVNSSSKSKKYFLSPHVLFNPLKKLLPTFSIKSKKGKFIWTIVILILIFIFFSLNSSPSFNQFLKDEPTFKVSAINSESKVKNLYFSIDDKTKTVSLVDAKSFAEKGVFYEGLNSKYTVTDDYLYISEVIGDHTLTIFLKDLQYNDGTYTAKVKILGYIPGVANSSIFNKNTYQKIILEKVK